MKKTCKKRNKMRPSLYKLQEELRELMRTDPDAVERKLDVLAETDADAAIKIGERIGFFEPEDDIIDLGSGVYCTGNVKVPEGLVI